MSFFSWFKKPEPSTAFSFDNGHLRWVSVVREEDGIQVVDYGSEFMGPDIVDADDVIVGEAAFVRKLRTLVTKEDGTSKFNVVNIVIPDRQAIMFHTHVARMEAREMGDVIIDHIKTYCEAHQLLNLQEYICEYDVIFQTAFGYDVHVTLVPKTYVSHLVRLFKQAGCNVKYIETAHHAVARSCLNIPNGTGYVFVSVGRQKTTVALVHGEHLVSQKTVSVGTDTLRRVIERFLRTSPESAEKIIERHGVLQTHPDNGLLGELYLELAPIAHAIDQEIIRLGQLSYKIYGHRFITRDMVVYGEGVGVKGLVGFLGEQSRLNARVLDVWAGRDDRAPILNLPAAETLTYAEPLALALLYVK